MSQDSDPASPVPSPPVPSPPVPPPPVPSPPVPPPLPPPRRRRKVATLAVAVAAVAVAAVVAIVLVTVPPAGQPQRSTGLPAAGQSQRSTGLSAAGQPQRYAAMPAPCALVPASTVALYVTGATSTGQGPSTSGTIETGTCTWSGLADGEVRMLTAQVSIYRSATGVTDAQNAFNTGIPEPRCNCDYDMYIPGLGDEVRESWSARGPSITAKSVTVSAQTSASAFLEARSGNTDILVSCDITPYRAGEVVSILTGEGEITFLAAAAHEILGALANPGAVPAAPPVVTPRYATPPDPCGLAATGTLTKYLPLPLDTTSKSLGEPGNRYSFCIWGSVSSGTQITVSADIYKSVGGASGAEQAFPGLAQTTGENTKGYGSDTVTDSTQVVTGIGNLALAIFQTETLVENGFTTYNAILVIWSGNADLQIQFNYAQGLPGSTPAPPRAAQLTALVTVARDVLANLPRS